MQSFANHVKSTLSKETGNKFTSSALTSFLSWVNPSDSHGLDDADLRLWISGMILNGYKKTTRKRYFGKLNNLYNEWTSDGTPSPFGKVTDAINTDFDFPTGEAEANLEIVQRLHKKSKDSIGWEYINAFLYLLYNVEASFADVINLKFDDAVVDLPQIDDIIDSMRGTRQLKYVFSLNRGAKREPQLKRELSADMEATLRMAGMKFNEAFSRESITAIWIATAFRCHIAVNEIRAIVKEIPAEYASLSLIDPQPISKERKKSILKTVADTINRQTNCWFAMRLRNGNTPDDIKEAIKSRTSDIFESMMFYYPTRTVYREGKGKKKIREAVPFVPGILFFRMRYDQVASLFNKIGDLAWCYRYSHSPSSPYSTISRHEMEKFQRHVGNFTSDIKMQLVTEGVEHFAVNDVVEIKGGMMAGNIGVITSVHNQDGTITYSLNLSADSSCRWTVEGIEDVLLAPTEII